MAWIESHQELKDHPKTKKLARILKISRPAVVGHLHLLWWWALDYAQDGDLSRYDAEDIADAVLWDSDTDELINALIESGFLDEEKDDLFIHNWMDYAGRLIAKREYNSNRMKKTRETKNDESGGSVENSGDDDVCKQRARTDRARANNVRARANNVRAQIVHVQTTCVATEPNLTVPNQPNLTEPDPTEPDTTFFGEELRSSSSPQAETVAVKEVEPHIKIPYSEILTLYNDICTSLPVIKRIDGNRKKAVEARFRAYGSIEVFKELFQKAESSAFLKGGGSKNFIANFDWLTKATNMAKVLEGRYENYANARASPGADARGNRFIDAYYEMERDGDG